ncbi:hypothetical protein D1007_19873 [Hordeum vulgare]|nr:hypothetical protein D1007_19873 [Hordeum vulgare]
MYVWLWMWHARKIPRAFDFTVLQRPNFVRPREFLGEGMPVEEGKQGPAFPVLIHLDEVKEFMMISEERDKHVKWLRTYRFKGKWRFGTKDGLDRARSMGSCSNHLVGRRSNDEECEGGGTADVVLRSSLSSSRRSQVAIAIHLRFIKRSEEFTDHTLLNYLNFFCSPKPPGNVANLVELEGLSSPAHLQLSDVELQVILEELAGGMA